VIEKSNDAPRPYELGEFTSRSSPKEWLAADAQPPINKFGLGIELNVTGPRFFHERKRKPAFGGTQATQDFHQAGGGVCWEIHQQTFSDPEGRFSRIEPTTGQRVSIETSGTQINCDEMHSLDSDFRTGAHFVTLRSRMIDFPKIGSWKLSLQFGAERIEACPDYDDLGNTASKRGAYQLADAFLS